jgi:hypothetical protein
MRDVQSGIFYCSILPGVVIEDFLSFVIQSLGFNWTLNRKTYRSCIQGARYGCRWVAMAVRIPIASMLMMKLSSSHKKTTRQYHLFNLTIRTYWTKFLEKSLINYLGLHIRLQLIFSTICTVLSV